MGYPAEPTLGLLRDLIILEAAHETIQDFCFGESFLQEDKARLAVLGAQKSWDAIATGADLQMPGSFKLAFHFPGVLKTHATTIKANILQMINEPVSRSPLRKKVVNGEPGSKRRD